MGATFASGALGGIASGVGSLASGILGSSSASSQSNKQMAWQSNERAEQNAWQSAENEKDRMWQAQQWANQFGAENAEFDRRFDMQNAYNDPSAVISRLKSAGINPAAALGQLTGTGGMAAAGGSSQPSNPAAMPSHSVTPLGLQNPTTTFNARDLMVGISDMMNAVTNRERLGLDSQKQKTLLDEMLNNLKKDSEAKESYANYNNIRSSIEDTLGRSKYSAEIQKLVAEAIKAESDKDLNEARNKLTKAIERIESIKGDIAEATKADLINQVTLQNNHLQSQIDLNNSGVGLNKARTSESYAAADEHLAGAELKRSYKLTEDDKRDVMVEGIRLDNKIKEAQGVIASIDAENVKTLKKEKFEALFQQLQREKYITDEQKEKAITAVKNNNWYDVREVLNQAESTSRTLKNSTSSARDVQRGLSPTGWFW